MRGYNIDWSLYDHRLGKVSDAALSRETGIPLATFHSRRVKLGIKACGRARSYEEPQEDRELRDLVHRFGVSNGEIVRHWRELGGLRGGAE